MQPQQLRLECTCGFVGDRQAMERHAARFPVGTHVCLRVPAVYIAEDSRRLAESSSATGISPRVSTQCSSMPSQAIPLWARPLQPAGAGSTPASARSDGGRGGGADAAAGVPTRSAPARAWALHSPESQQLGRPCEQPHRERPHASVAAAADLHVGNSVASRGSSAAQSPPRGQQAPQMLTRSVPRLVEEGSREGSTTCSVNELRRRIEARCNTADLAGARSGRSSPPPWRHGPGMAKAKSACAGFPVASASGKSTTSASVSTPSVAQTVPKATSVAASDSLRYGLTVSSKCSRKANDVGVRSKSPGDDDLVTRPTPSRAPNGMEILRWPSSRPPDRPPNATPRGTPRGRGEDVGTTTSGCATPRRRSEDRRRRQLLPRRPASLENDEVDEDFTPVTTASSAVRVSGSARSSGQNHSSNSPASSVVPAARPPRRLPRSTSDRSISPARTISGSCSPSTPSSHSASRSKQLKQSAERTLRRCSNGLVFNPGSATVELVERRRGERRFSVAPGAGGAPSWTPLPAGRGQLESDTEVDEANRGENAEENEAGGGCLQDVFGGMHEAVGDTFTRFMTASSAEIACATFDRLLAHCGRAAPTGGARSAPWAAPEALPDRPFERIRRLSGLPWRAQQIWKLLDDHVRHAEYVAAPLRKTRAVVCGAGPCGLRTALELALLRAEVVVAEKRSANDACCRINRVHLWEWCKQDLLSWGAKTFDPPGGTFGGDNDFCHIGIGELQLLLLKNALLLGVRFRFRCEAESVEHGALLCRGGTVRLPCDALVLADGANSPLSRRLGLRSVTVGLRGKGSAIGVVANFVNSRDAHEMALRQFSWARQFNAPLFADIEAKTNVNLENIVYYKGAQHYIVMTPTKGSLLANGVLLSERPASGHLLEGANVSFQELSAMVRRIAAFFGLPDQLCESQGAMIFDFSGVKRLENAATIVSNIFVCAAGDALLEPFWPEGLGIMRGFMSAMDAAAAVVMSTKGELGRDNAVSQLATTYNVLKSVAAQSASQCLQKDMRRYRLAPETRYIISGRG
eukprot:TRINITY_DN8670_c0_g1_i5.p1 TRINITY_DN8670_c0_g1~~TRINITY_DN8670_c0_g1_i5.p1  ORF type:complete len:1034 (-),score=129.63 TRINITY_DN8670_c0_g1_i5:119-3220(-)